MWWLHKYLRWVVLLFYGLLLATGFIAIGAGGNRGLVPLLQLKKWPVFIYEGAPHFLNASYIPDWFPWLNPPLIRVLNKLYMVTTYWLYVALHTDFIWLAYSTYCLRYQLGIYCIVIWTGDITSIVRKLISAKIFLPF